MDAQASKDERVELRISSADKKLIKRAQKLSGDKSFSSFVVRVLKKEAEGIVAENDQIIATEKDRQVFFDAIFSNRKPNQSLVAASEKYKSNKP